MNNDHHQQIYRNLRQKNTDELTELSQSKNPSEWTDMTFDVIQWILQERSVEALSQNEQVFEANDTSSPAVSDASNMSLAQMYFSFNGRIGLKTYWLCALPIVWSLMAFPLIDAMYFDYTPYSGVLTWGGRLLILWPSLALTVKRWHDRDKSGWWTLIGLIPYIGPIWTFIENGLLPGTKGPNQHGAKSF